MTARAHVNTSPDAPEPVDRDDERPAAPVRPTGSPAPVPDWQARPGDLSPYGARPTQQIGHSQQVHPPQRTGADVQRPGRVRRLLRLGVPTLSGAAVAASTMLLGLGNVFAGPLDTVVVGLGLGAVAASGTGLLLRRRRHPQDTSAPLASADEEIRPRTRDLLERTADVGAGTRDRLDALRRTTTEPRARQVLADTGALVDRIDALARSDDLRQRAAHDGSLAMLEGMATRYIPDLVEATEQNVEFLATFTGSAREEAVANLASIDRQLDVLGEGLEQIEQDVVSGATRSLEVHAEFLRHRFAAQQLPPIIDL